MPVAAREAMLEGLRANERIIAGAYVDGQGGVCPMLAAHRQGVRTDFLSFAKSWDRFARTAGRSRQATAREVRILIRQLEASLEEDSGLELDTAIAEHRALLAQRRRDVRSRASQQSEQAGSRSLPDQADPSGWIIARRIRARRAERKAAERILAHA
jgi:hypothetical protein